MQIEVDTENFQTGKPETTEDQKAPEAEGTVEPEGTSSDAVVSEGSKDLIGGKFESQEDLLKAYQELESKLGSQEKPEEAEGLEVSTGEKEEEETTQEPTGTEESEVDFEKYTRSIKETGALTEADYTELAEKHKLPKHIVDAYVQGLQAQAQIQQTGAEERKQMGFELVGGQENYSAMAKWASTNLSKQELQEFNDAVSSNQTFTVKAAVTHLYNTYTKAVGSESTTVISGKPNNTSGLVPFKNSTEMSDAMADPRYKSDPKFRKNVSDRVALGFK